MGVPWPPIFHSHWCPQCDRAWECACEDAKNPKKWCPNGDLCHILPGETVDKHTIPKTRRPSRGVGPLFTEVEE